MSLRTKVTLAFTAMLAVVLAASGAFLYLRFSADLRETQDRGLRSRAAQLVAAVERGPVAAALPDAPGIEVDEDVAQVLAADGSVIAASAAAGRPLLADSQRVAALRRPRFVDRAGDAVLEESVRLLAVPARAAGRAAVAVVGASRDEVDEAAATLALLEATGLGGALLVGAAGAWLLAGAVARPVHAALERERRFVADASHELRTPLAILKSELEVTRMEAGDADALAALRSAEEEVDRLNRLAQDLLLLAHSDEDGLVLRIADVDVDDVLARASRGFGAVEHRTCDVHVRGDALRLEQAVRNLVDNAVRHGAPPVQVACERSADAVTITVRDHGAGVPAGFAEHAFDRFSRGDPGRGHGGAGLGLSIAAAIAHAHGGTVELTDARPGTVAAIRIPHRSLIAAAQD